MARRQRSKSVEADISAVRSLESANTINLNFLEWLAAHDRVVYGNTAINAVLPHDLKFYSNHALTDYDVLTPDAAADVRSITAAFGRRGQQVVAAPDPTEPASQRVFVNSVVLARITQVPKHVYRRIRANALQGNGLHVAPVDYLRMALLFELTQQTSPTAWNDTFDKLLRLNRAFNLVDTTPTCEPTQEKDDEAKAAMNVVKDHLQKTQYVLCGYAAAAMALADGSWPSEPARLDARNTCMDILATNPETAAAEFAGVLASHKSIKNRFTIAERRSASGVFPRSFVLFIDGRPFVGFIHADQCLPYVQVEGLRVATLDTLLALYLRAFVMDRPTTNLRCLCDVLAMHQHNRFNSKKPIFKRYVTECYGRKQ